MNVVINNNTELQTIAEQTKTTRNNISTVVARARPSLPVANEKPHLTLSYVKQDLYRSRPLSPPGAAT